MDLIRANDLDLARLIQPGDVVVLGQGSGEPLTLSEMLVEQRSRLGGIQLFLGASFSRVFQPEHCDFIRYSGLGGVGASRRLIQNGGFEIYPVHMSQLPGHFAEKRIRCDVVLLQAGIADDGRWTFGVTSDYMSAAIANARTVIAEVNSQVPRTRSRTELDGASIDIAIQSDRPLLAVPAAAIGPTEERIARHVSEFIPDRAVLQIGIGAIPEAIMSQLRDRKDLGIHSGMIGDSVAELVEAGVITNAFKPIDAGSTVTGTLIGTEKLFRFADGNTDLLVERTEYTHNPQVLTKFHNFISINSALEVDLTGQINSESVNGQYMGAVGGALDYVRAAVASPGGHSIIALQSMTGNRSKIVSQLSGPATTPRSDADIIVTEWGAAQLRGLSLRQRTIAMLGIAHPEHRERLEREARGQGLLD